ncbi:hypothetical protein Hanom_Chr17g01573611 [Helianthus anomalus]
MFDSDLFLLFELTSGSNQFGSTRDLGQFRTLTGVGDEERKTSQETQTTERRWPATVVPVTVVVMFGSRFCSSHIQFKYRVGFSSSQGVPVHLIQSRISVLGSVTSRFNSVWVCFGPDLAWILAWFNSFGSVNNMQRVV